MPNIEMVGRVDPEEKVPIISFNIKHKDRILHPRFVTKLLNDLFGIQSRAGCSCAGPYGHILLDISDELSAKYRDAVQKGLLGLKPGWVRINIHYTFTKNDVNFLERAIEFVALYGHLFLPKYKFNIHTGEWSYEGFQEKEIEFGVENEFRTEKLNLQRIEDIRQSYFEQAGSLVEALMERELPPFVRDNPEIEDLKSFYYCTS